MTSAAPRLIILSELSSVELGALCVRAEGGLEDMFDGVRSIVDAVKRGGDSALLDLTKKFDRVDISRIGLRVQPEEFEAAGDMLSADIKGALELASTNVRRFHDLQMPATMSLHETEPGVLVGDRWGAIDSVACYVPRGKGSFPSSVLMTCLPARAAGVPRVAIVTPPGPEGSVDAATLYAARLCGVDEVYRCGGAQAVAAVAYGTESIPKCSKIVGPGSTWVAAAKKLLSGVIDPGSPAGPSELIVFADDTVSADLVAMDLTVESEHGPDSSVYLVTTSRELALQVVELLPSHWSQMGEQRASFSQAVLSGQRGGILVAEDIGEAFGFINAYAAEHLAVLSSNPWRYLDRIRHAGEILLGPHSAIAVANFVLGPSHVLPTGGAAKTTSPLSVFDFLKRTSVASVSPSAYSRLAPYAERLARYEGFEGHAQSVSSRRSAILSNE